MLLYNYERCRFCGMFQVETTGMPIDRTAFGGRFPAQAQFRLISGSIIDLSADDVSKQIRHLWRKGESGKPVPVLIGSDARLVRTLFPVPRRLPEAKSPPPPPQLVPQTLEYVTVQGFRVRSKAEKIIADALDRHAIRCRYGREIPAAAPLQYDFYLPDYDIYIEHWGLKGHGAYDERRRAKEREYARLGYRLIGLEPDDEAILEDVLVQHFQRWGVDCGPRPARLGFLRRLIERILRRVGFGRSPSY